MIQRKPSLPNGRATARWLRTRTSTRQKPPPLLCSVASIDTIAQMRYVDNPPNPWLTHSVEWIGEPPAAKIEVFEETETRTIISSNDSPDVAFDHSVNCYRGCVHGCTYCFSGRLMNTSATARALTLNEKIIAKVRAPELLRKELMKRSWQGDEIVFSFTSDPYIPLEANYKLTRGCLEVCAEFRNPVGIVTKSALIRRDIDVLQRLTQDAASASFFPFRLPITILRGRSNRSRLRPTRDSKR